MEGDSELGGSALARGVGVLVACVDPRPCFRNLGVEGRGLFNVNIVMLMEKEAFE